LQFVIEQRFAELEKLVVAVQARGLDEQVASYLCKLGSVLVCGNLEKCVEHLLIEKVGGESQPRVTNFLKTHFRMGRNYDCENILQLMFRFDSDWGRKFEKFVEENSRIKEGVSSCYAVRNSVAHGGGNSFGPSALKQYYDATLTLVAELERIIR
jgi:hypothetical protein